jgi:RNA-directed DNA polymerase
VSWIEKGSVAIDMSKARGNLMKEWSSIDWRKLERRLFKLQKRIFKASQRGDVKAVRRLQKTLMRSWSAKCLAVLQNLTNFGTPISPTSAP